MTDKNKILYYRSSVPRSEDFLQWATRRHQTRCNAVSSGKNVPDFVKEKDSIRSSVLHKSDVEVCEEILYIDHPDSPRRGRAHELKEQREEEEAKERERLRVLAETELPGEREARLRVERESLAAMPKPKHYKCNDDFKWDGNPVIVTCIGTVQCPHLSHAQCSTTEPSEEQPSCLLYGSGPYVANSTPCCAAWHSGVVQHGGNLTYKLVASAKKLDDFLGTTKNGVTSKPWSGPNDSFEVVLPSGDAM